MKASLCAILSRFNGNRGQAWMYCLSIALAYPALAEEYSAYAKELL